MIGQIVAGETPIKIGWQIRDARAIGPGVEHKSGNVSAWLAHPCRLRRIDRESRNEGERHCCVGIHSQRGEHPAKGENIGFFKSAQHGVAFRGRSWVGFRSCGFGAPPLRLQPQVGVLRLTRQFGPLGRAGGWTIFQ